MVLLTKTEFGITIKLIQNGQSIFSKIALMSFNLKEAISQNLKGNYNCHGSKR